MKLISYKSVEQAAANYMVVHLTGQYMTRAVPALRTLPLI